MPKEIITYQCQYCNTIHDNIIMAEKCESSHIPIRDYMPKYNNRNSRYPDKFELIFDDKSKLTYYKDEPSPQPSLG